MTPQEKLLAKERLEKILPDWEITDELYATTRNNTIIIAPQETNQITKLGLFVSGVYSGISDLTVEFSEMNR